MDVFPARQHGLASGLPCKAAPYLFRGSDGVRAVFRQLDGGAHAPACLRDGRRPASAAVRDVPNCTRAFRRDACKRNSAVIYRGLVHLPPSFQWGRENSADGEKQRLLRRVPGQKNAAGRYAEKRRPCGTGISLPAVGAAGTGRLPAGGGKAAGLSKAGNAGAGARTVPPHFLHRSRSVRPYLMQSAPDICPGRRCFYLKVVGQAAVLQKIKFGRVHGAEIQRDTENVR